MEELLGPTAVPLRDILLRTGAAALFGLVVGLDREVRGFSAGVRTHMLVALSSAITMLIAIELQRNLAVEGSSGDPTRAIQGLAQAIGFLCAGVIFVARGTVHGLTTAASLWMTSAIGMAAGAGFMRIALVGALAAVLIVTVIWLIERLFGKPAPAPEPGADAKDMPGH
jgi:putative Mg2+ transporter-C (MgtC) family protein